MKKLKSKILLDCPIKVVSKTGPDFKTVSDMFLNIFFKVFFSIKQCAHLSFRQEPVLGRSPPPLLWLSRAEDDSSSLDAACACVELSASTSGSCLSAQMLAQKHQNKVKHFVKIKFYFFCMLINVFLVRSSKGVHCSASFLVWRRAQLAN